MLVVQARNLCLNSRIQVKDLGKEVFAFSPGSKEEADLQVFLASLVKFPGQWENPAQTKQGSWHLRLSSGIYTRTCTYVYTYTKISWENFNLK